jgi:hypothetical protein
LGGDRNPPRDQSLAELPFFPQSEAVCFSRPEQKPTIPNSFDAQNLQTLLHGSYDFRTTFLESLDLTDLPNAIHVFGIKLTPKEKARHLNPLRVFFSDMSTVEELMRLGWGITMVGRKMKDLLNFLLAPITSANRSDGYPIAPFTAANHLLHFNKINRACHERKVGCLLFFTPPQQHAACLPTQTRRLPKRSPDLLAARKPRGRVLENFLAMLSDEYEAAHQL